MRNNVSFILGAAIFLVLLSFGCSKSADNHSTSDTPPSDTTVDTAPPVSEGTQVTVWLTTADRTVLFEKQNAGLTFTEGAASGGLPVIKVDTTTTFQSIDGFGFCLTDASAYLIHQLPSDKKETLLKELFSVKDKSIGISYLRITIGASDLSLEPYSYDDMPTGQTDINLNHFTLERDKTVNFLIPVLQDILKINPDIKILGSPWSAPVWMKDNNSTVGGSLQQKYYEVYAQYFVKYIQAMNQNGINIDAVTPQNEPMNPKNNPSMYMTWEEERDFVKDALGPAFENAGIKTKIIVWDHNADLPSYPINILKDADAAKYIDGSAFHLYNGSITALSKVHDAFPDKNLYFTEQYTPKNGSFSGDLEWHMKNLIIGATRNWSKNVIEWNLASNPDYDLHTNGGCSTCKGALMINKDDVTKEVSYYIIASASKFVRPGAVRVSSDMLGNLPNVAFQNRDGTKVLIVWNNSDDAQLFNIQFNDKVVTTRQPGKSVGTYIWK